MALPIRTTLADVQAVCQYLSTKPTGATLKEARTVVDRKRLDGRKLNALIFWGLIEEKDAKYRVTSQGREVSRDGGAKKASVLRNVIGSTEAYRAIIERVAHRDENSLSATEVAAHWHEHFADQVSDSDRILNDQAVCFFQLAMGADLGELVIGRRGAATRFEFSSETVQAFIVGKPVAEADATRQPSEDPPATGQKLETPAPGGSLVSGKQLGQAIFLAHGKNKKPVEQLKKILEQFKIPYKVAVEEPNLGRPIGNKVRKSWSPATVRSSFLQPTRNLGTRAET